MRFVKLDGLIDPGLYLERLPSFADALPAGARAFATDPDHYDFGGPRCVKDLKMQRLEFSDVDGGLCLDVGFRHNCWKHEDDLAVRYVGVRGCTVDLPAEAEQFSWRRDVILDEILPLPEGCTHEIALQAGSFMVTCRDLTAVWTEADCPDKP